MPSQPYPAHLVTHWQAPDGTPVTIRPIRPEDAAIEHEFVKGLSSEARYLRFMSAIRELTPAMLVHFTQLDYERDMALIAVIQEGGREIQIGVARYMIDTDNESCEFAIVVGDRFQGRGLGQHLMLLLIEIARARPFKSMTGYILSTNKRMLSLAQTLGFVVEPHEENPSVTRVRLTLQPKV